MVIFRKELLDIIDFAIERAADNICVCPHAVPDWDDNNLTDEVIERQLDMLKIIRKYVEVYP